MLIEAVMPVCAAVGIAYSQAGPLIGFTRVVVKAPMLPTVTVAPPS